MRECECIQTVSFSEECVSKKNWSKMSTSHFIHFKHKPSNSVSVGKLFFFFFSSFHSIFFYFFFLYNWSMMRHTKKWNLNSTSKRQHSESNSKNIWLKWARERRMIKAEYLPTAEISGESVSDLTAEPQPHFHLYMPAEDRGQRFFSVFLQF